MANIIGSGNKKDKWTKRVTDLLNWLNEKKQATLVAGENVTLTPQQDGTVKIDASGAAALDDLTDVDVSSVTDGQALVYDETNEKWVAGEAGQVDDVKVNGTSVVSNKIAEVISYKEVTQAEYDALPATKLTDNVLYCVKDSDIDVNNKFAPVIYSTNERMIGVWFDGKPLYEKSGIIPYSAFTTEGVQKVVSIAPQLGLSNIDIKYYEGELRSSIYGRSLLGARTYNTNQSVSQDLSNWYGESSFYYGQVALRMYNDATTLFDRWAPDLQITVRYTKNDDVAGSGIYGTNEVPMKHYDGDEKVIGTWFGETMYEKTISGAVASTSASFDVSSLNIRLVVGAEGFAIQGNNNEVMLNFANPNANPISSDMAIFYYQASTQKIQVRAGSSAGQGTWYITLRYVKNYQ